MSTHVEDVTDTSLTNYHILQTVQNTYLKKYMPAK